MGATQCCISGAMSPPDPNLVGTWLLNEQSRTFQIHENPMRESYKQNSTIKKDLTYKKITIKGNGFIHYMEGQGGSIFKIDGPVARWGNGRVQTANGSILIIDFHNCKDGYITVQKDRLYKI